MNLRHSCAVMLALAAAGCGGRSSPFHGDLGSRVGAQLPQRPEPLRRFAYSGLNEPARRVIADPGTWAGVWAEVTRQVSPAPELPVVDFTAHQIVLAAMGTRPTGGYAITIDSLVEFEQGSVVFVTSVSPGSDCGTTQALTAPVDIVLIERSQDPIVFSDRDAVHRCS